MNSYKVTFTRQDSGIKSETILAADETQARNIFADCEVLRVELVERDYDQAMKSQENAARIWTCNMRVTDEGMKAVHNYIVAAEAGDAQIAELTAAAYGDAGLTKRRDDLLYALKDEPCTREQANAAIDELAELETKIVNGVSSPAWFDAQDERSL